jgi:transposase
VGKERLFLTDVLFALWYKVRDGTRSRRWLWGQVEGRLRAEVRGWLERGAGCGSAKTAGVCQEVLKLEPTLWTFTRVAGVEPTNDAAERALRPAVLKRKRSFGCSGADGCRFVERLFSVTHTLRLRQRPILDYLVGALVAHRHGLPAPQLPAAARAVT